MRQIPFVVFKSGHIFARKHLAVFYISGFVLPVQILFSRPGRRPRYRLGQLRGGLPGPRQLAGHRQVPVPVQSEVPKAPDIVEMRILEFIIYRKNSQIGTK